MRFAPSLVVATLVPGFALLALPSSLRAQSAPPPVTLTFASLPDAPDPQNAPAQNTPQPSPDSSSSQTAQPAAQPDASQKKQHDTAADQLKAEEHQRVLGIMPSFGVVYGGSAVSLTGRQKMHLALRSAIDPFTFAAAILVAGIHESRDEDPEFGWGPAGFGKRAGAAYLDSADGTIIGNGILPALLHQDPRYFRLGHGSVQHRILYAAAASIICKHDNTGHWEPNYSNIGGNLAAGALSNLYYPSQESGIGQTFTNDLIVTAEGAFSSIFQEFWPDISRKIFHKDPSNGQDALATAKDKARKNNASPAAK